MLDFSYNLDSVFSHELCKSAFSDGIFWDSGVEPRVKERRYKRGQKNGDRHDVIG